MAGICRKRKDCSVGNYKTTKTWSDVLALCQNIYIFAVDVIESIVVDEVLDQNTSKEEILVVDENATTEQNLAEEQIKEQKEEVQVKEVTVR